MKTIPNGETATKRFVVNADKKQVNVVCTTRPNKDDPRVVMGLVLDFSKCADADILTLAARSVVIEIQRLWRDAPEKVRADENTWERTWDVKADILGREKKRTPKDPVKTAEKALEALTPEQIAAALAKYRQR